jgi:hypothetical protein
MIWPPVEATDSTAAANGGRESGALHQRNCDRTVDQHVGHRTARHGAEQARAHHRDLAWSAGGVPGERQREIHEQLADAGALHERAEQHEHDDVGGGHAERRAEDAFGGQVQDLDDLLRPRLGDERAVDQEHDRGNGQRPADHAPGGFQHDHGEDRAQDEFGLGRVVDEDEPG